MKKITVLVSLLTLLFMSCISFNIPDPGFDILTIDNDDSNMVDLTLTPVWIKNYSAGGSVSGLFHFFVNISNNINEDIQVIWAESSISYGGDSYIPFLHQKDTKTAEPAPLVVPKGYRKRTKFYSPRQLLNNSKIGNDGKIYFEHGIPSIPDHHIVLVFCIQSSDKKVFYTVDVRRKSDKI